LALIAGKPMLYHVWQRAQAAQVDQVLVATDDDRIADYCRQENIAVMVTARHHPTGTDRLAEVAEQLKADIYVNVQGDEPLIAPESINRVIACLQQQLDQGFSVATGYLEGSTPEQQQSPNVVHLVPNLVGGVMLLSRSPVPFAFQRQTSPHIHVGLYAFTKNALLSFAGRQQGPLERAESIELLRFLEYCDPIACVPVLPGSIGVDRPEDIALVEANLLSNLQN
jgi:3-deoxy-manno-octulosonate cytidylyltransferase (CMP-KDO synthetase)